MTDTEIIDLFFERSEQAIDELAKKHGSAVARVERNILGNEQDTEECVNDTYLGTWNAIPPHKPSPLRTFVCKIARNLATMKYHSNTAEKRNSQYDLALDELEECLSDNGSVEEVYEAKELREAINGFIRGWLGYFGIASMRNTMKSWDEWLRRRFRMYIWKQWKQPRTRVKNLLKLGAPDWAAYQYGYSRKGYWRMSGTTTVNRAISKERLAQAGYYSILDRYESQHLCG